MKKTILYLTVATGFLFACSKNSKNDAPGPDPAPKTVNVKDPKALTAAVKVYHGSLVNGAFPDASGAGAPVLSTTNYKDVIPAISGRYAVLPLILNVPDGQNPTAPKGAYVKIVGADSYFDIDFSKPLNGRQAPTKHNGIARDAYADSVVVIKLPEDITKDTFKVELAIYNAQKQVSNKVTIAIATIAAGGGSANTAFQATWIPSRYKDDSTNLEWKPAMVDRVDSGYLVCVNNQLNFSETNIPGAKKYYLGEYHDVKNETTFGAGGQGSSEYLVKRKNLDYNKSTCDNLVYVENNDGSKEVFGWSYNTSTQLMTLVYDGNGINGEFDFEVIRMRIENNKLYMNERLKGIREYVKK
ncbi:hypothetical protein KTO58_09225 [Chitinophaga pendula]|uniref:hypothetical protein n=1 Tax=Chitinophaga TaxID=79328 RepID=UPI000BAFAC44|nr:MULTISPECIES: hypothetical protein [Chitinophaga]ASZ13021.1 hypothetical protein CK934_19685 [Chitinophaga sp. MD30]UCJ09348.1 hypothetical protein KTO58_09225 [Chitinophaga pendula]